MPVEPPRTYARDEQRAKQWRRRYAIFVACGIAVLFLRLLPHLSAGPVWDDAYMFVRYADNVLQEGKLAWNPGGEPVYGLTAPLYLAAVIPMRLAFPATPALAAQMSSLACGLVLIVLLAALVRRCASPDSASGFVIALIVLGPTLLFDRMMVTHFLSGMDTTFALAALTTFLLLAVRLESRPGPVLTLLLGLVGGVLFLARPDLVVYSLGVPAAGAVFYPDPRRRRYSLIAGSIAVAIILLEMLGAWHVLGSPLPLPFFAKRVGAYGPWFRGVYRLTGIRQLARFVIDNAELFVLPLAFLAVARRRWWHESSAVEKGLLAATAVFFAFYLIGVQQVMYFDARFYFPTLPALVVIASRNGVRLARDMPERFLGRWRSSSRRFRTGAAGSLIVLLVGATALAGRHAYAAGRPERFLHFDVGKHLRDPGSQMLKIWLGLPEMSDLPDDLTVAATEVGAIAALNPRKTIIDLAGLNDTWIVLHDFSAAQAVAHYKPDLIYMPHPDYRAMNRDLLADPYFIAHYEYFAAHRIGAFRGLALRRDSPYFVRMRAIVAAHLDADAPS